MNKEGPRLVVIADDLTGANDTGVQFAKRGIRTVVLANSGVAEWPKGYEVIVINTESRHLAPAEAAERVSRVAKMGRACGVDYYFKKTDSTLRGNVGAELEALYRATETAAIPFIPAFPEAGRTTKGGVHYVQGAPIAETAFRNDPLNPIRSSRIADILQEQTTVPVHEYSTCSWKETAAGIGVFDCDSEAGLAGLAEALCSEEVKVFAGSAAFADQVARWLDLPRQKPVSVHLKAPLLLVNGSLHERAFEQIRNVPLGSFRKVKLTAKELVSGPNLANSADGNLLLYTVEDRSELELLAREAGGMGMIEQSLHLEVARAMGVVVQTMLRSGNFGTLVVFGGDTLAGIAEACGWEAFVPLTELGPGLTLAKPEREHLLVLSKPGGFGDREVVRQILRSLGRRER